MIQISTLFETHLTVTSLHRAVRFYRDVLGAGCRSQEYIQHGELRFSGLAAPGRAMLGLWEVGNGPQRMSLHTAFGAALEDLLAAPDCLRAPPE